MQSENSHNRQIGLVGCCGSFDYKLHPGHIEFLNFASSLGQKLIVFVVTDSVYELRKGRKPYYSQDLRISNLNKLGCVERAIPLCGDDLGDQIQIIEFGLDIYVFGPDQNSTWNLELEQKLIQRGVKTINCRPNKLYSKYSTTEILIREGKLKVDNSFRQDND